MVLVLLLPAPPQADQVGHMSLANHRAALVRT